MNRLFMFSVSLVTVFLLFQSCKQTEQNVEKEVESPTVVTEAAITTPGFVHAVYFWLKKDNPDLVNEFINEGLPQLAKVPSIQSVSWGPPAGTERVVVDNSYDIAWIVNFANAEDQDEYQVDPLHLEFVEKYKSIFDRVQVYDNVVNEYSAN